jgi:flagellar secretion chaperone FliS
MTQTDLLYRKTAIQGASGLDLLIALYDTLAGDLRRAAEAQRAGNLEKRSNEIKHALLVVSHLENWVEPDSGDLAKKLRAFYSRLRRKTLEAQGKQSAEILDGLMAETIRMREIWQKLDLRGMAYGPEILPPTPAPRYGGFAAAAVEHRQFSWSA